MNDLAPAEPIVQEHITATGNADQQLLECQVTVASPVPARGMSLTIIVRRTVNGRSAPISRYVNEPRD